MAARIKSHPSRASRSLVTALATTFVVLSVTPLLLVSSLLGYFDFQTQREALYSQQQLIAANAATEVSGFVEQIFSMLETSARVGQVSDQQQQKLILEKLLGFKDALREITLVDKEGQEIAGASRRSIIASSNLTKLAESDIMDRVLQDRHFISEVYFDEETSEPLVVLAVPVEDVFGEFQGALITEVNLKFMWDVVDQLQVGETGLAYVVDKQGDLIAFGDAARVLEGENLGQLTEVSEFINGSGTDEYELYVTGINGSAVTAAYVPLGLPDWAVVTEIPVTEAYRSSLYSVAIVLGGFLIMVILAVGAGAYASRSLTTPLLNLTKTTARLAAGETGLRAAVEGPIEVMQLASAFNDMTGQLQELIGSLEERVTDRTRQLETVVQISQRLAGILDLSDLLRQVVNLTKEVFNYYHVHIYLLDEKAGTLLMTAGYGEAGAEMQTRGHVIPITAPKSLVARAAREGKVITVENVRLDPDWLPNPLLPDTYSEMAVPVMLGIQVVGVLDVQSEKIGGLTNEDEVALQALANQVATAVRNARLFSETQEALYEAQRLQQLYTGQAWEKLGAARTFDYEFCQPNLPPLAATPIPEAVAALQQKRTIDLRTPSFTIEPGVNGESRSEISSASETQAEQNPQSVHTALATPLKLRDQIIGVLGIHCDDPQRHWTADEIALIEAISEQMSLAIENARLFEETGRRAGRERLIADVTQHVWASGELERVMQTAVEQLGVKLDASKVIIQLGIGDDLLKNK